MRNEHFLHYYDSNYQRSESVSLFLPSLHLSNLLLILASLFLSSLLSSLLMLSLPLSPDPIVSLFTIFSSSLSIKYQHSPKSLKGQNLECSQCGGRGALSPVYLFPQMTLHHLLRWQYPQLHLDTLHHCFGNRLCQVIKAELMPPAHRNLAPFLSLSLSILLFKCHCYWTKNGVMERQLMLYFGKFLSKCLW